MPILSRVPVLAGTATVALALVAGPAFAVGPQMVQPASTTTTATAVRPTVRITPAHLSAHQYAKGGIVAHLTGFPASTPVAFGLGNGASGGPIAEGTAHVTTAAGTLNLAYLPPKAEALVATYTLTAFYTAPAAGTTSATALAADPATAASVPVAFTVKPSDAKVTWTPAKRSGTRIALGATVARWSPKAHAYVAWRNAAVKFQERIDGVWRTKTTVLTNRKGVAARTVSARVHTWRALVVTTSTTWGVASRAHTK